MKKGAKTNLKIIFSAIVLLAVMMGVVYSFSITINAPTANTQLNWSASGIYILNITVTATADETGYANVTNATFYWNQTGGWTEIGKNMSGNITNMTLGWDISAITNGTYSINVTVTVNGTA